MSLYSPARFVQQDTLAINALIDAYPFATLVSVEGEAPHITHVPVIRLDNGDLLTHMATASPHAQLLQDGAKLTAIFNGPHDYVSPTWYAQAGVPTWNYAVVHVRGAVQVIAEPAAKQAAMDRLIARFEQGEMGGRSPHMSYAERAALLDAIHVFSVRADTVQAKFKLSQNKSESDRRYIIASLSARGTPEARALADLMQAELDRASAAQPFLAHIPTA